MLTISIDTEDHLTNVEVSEVTQIHIAQNTIRKVKFSDPQAGLKAMAASYFSRQPFWVVFEKIETEILIKKGSTSPSIKRTQFLLAVASPSTAQNVKDLSLDQGVTGFDLKKQNSFELSQIHTAVSRIKAYANLFCIRKYERP